MKEKGIITRSFFCVFLSLFKFSLKENFYSLSLALKRTKRETLPSSFAVLLQKLSFLLSLRAPMAVDDEAAQLAAAAALPLRERAKHKNWKARVAAFEDIATSSTAAGAADDEAGPF